MRSRNLSSHIDPHRDRQPPAQSDVGVSAMNELTGVLAREQDNHRNYPNTEENEYKRPKKFGDQLRNQSRFRTQMSLLNMADLGR